MRKHTYLLIRKITLIYSAFVAAFPAASLACDGKAVGEVKLRYLNGKDKTSDPFEIGLVLAPLVKSLVAIRDLQQVSQRQAVNIAANAQTDLQSSAKAATDSGVKQAEAAFCRDLEAAESQKNDYMTVHQNAYSCGNPGSSGALALIFQVNERFDRFEKAKAKLCTSKNAKPGDDTIGNSELMPFLDALKK